MPFTKDLPTPWILSGMEAANQKFDAPFRAFLGRLLADPLQHARFLNTLSLLEHMGSRKIMLSQMNKVLTLEILKHIAEETRHAFFFKRHAEKLLKRTVDGYTPADTLCVGPGRFYFGRLDAAISRATPEGGHPETTYLWVSLIIELRACWVYHIYQDVLEAHGLPFSLKSVIAEEDLHMAEMHNRLTELGAEPDSRIKDLSTIETALFANFFAQLDAATLPTSEVRAA